jgi:hypothetical protein
MTDMHEITVAPTLTEPEALAKIKQQAKAAATALAAVF